MTGEQIIYIFEKLGFNCKNIPSIGRVIMMSPGEAYLLSAMTGAKYLFYENGVTMKDRSEVFVHRSVFSNGHLIYSPGLFSRTADGYISEGNSADRLNQLYPYVFNGDKKVLILDIPPKVPSNVEHIVFKKIYDTGENPSDYVIYKNYLSNNIGESLQEYFAAKYFMGQGFIVENQVPWFQQNYKYNGKVYQGGIPDFSAFHSPISNDLLKYGIISHSKGVSVRLIPVLRMFRSDFLSSKNNITRKLKRRLIIGEAKTSSSSLSQAIEQLNKYKGVDIADEFFTIIPDSKSNPYHGSMYIDSDYSIKYIQKSTTITKTDRIKTDGQWIDTYIKTLLLGNISFDKVIGFIDSYRKKSGLAVYGKYKSTHLLDAVQNTNNTEMLEYIRNNL